LDEDEDVVCTELVAEGVSLAAARPLLREVEPVVGVVGCPRPRELGLFKGVVGSDEELEMLKGVGHRRHF
jgi:hypothetical protein